MHFNCGSLLTNVDHLSHSCPFNKRMRNVLNEPSRCSAGGWRARKEVELIFSALKREDAARNRPLRMTSQLNSTREDCLSMKSSVQRSVKRANDLRENATSCWKSVSGIIVRAPDVSTQRWWWSMSRTNTFTLGNAEKSLLDAWKSLVVIRKLNSSLDTLRKECCEISFEFYVPDVRAKIDDK